MKPKNGKKAKLFYTDTNGFIVHVKLEDIYEDLAGDVKTISLRKKLTKSKVKRPRLIGKSKKISGQRKIN